MPITLTSRLEEVKKERKCISYTVYFSKKRSQKNKNNVEKETIIPFNLHVYQINVFQTGLH